MKANERAELEEIRAGIQALIDRLQRIIERPNWTDTGSGPGYEEPR